MIQPETLHQHLKLCYDDPARLSGHKSDEKVWVFEILMSLLKQKRDGFKAMDI